MPHNFNRINQNIIF